MINIPLNKLRNIRGAKENVFTNKFKKKIANQNYLQCPKETKQW